MTKLSLYLATMLLGSNFSASAPPPRPAVIQPAQTQSEAAEQRFVALANSERWSRGLNMLAINPMLVKVAREHSQEMYEKNYFDHISPTPELRTPMTRYIHEFGKTPAWAFLGENLFYCSVVSVDRGHNALMNSEKHRENVLNPKFEQTGVGVYIAPDGQFYVTQLFLAQVD